MIVLAHIIVVVVTLILFVATAVILHDVGWQKVLQQIVFAITFSLIIVAGISVWWAIDTVLIYYGVYT